MEHETDLVGERRTATGAIGGELRLMQLDQILGLAARAIQAVVLGRADIEAGDDEADASACSIFAASHCIASCAHAQLTDATDVARCLCAVINSASTGNQSLV
jgi:hypothetical protein